ncbi:D-amino acid dehydrogenase small subunit [Candidatus Terasakiella magnetica]|uniref:D-amino acid dehydrogenase small subunit n=1 Tax=Candidatus Terasakiella magnetica TaxID=1867952 RepID=A0A1C3RCH3_9PROT|nr:D-amino acid dehydrogenase [Candidatus Terasakiella magnetica]SCA54979.1 D-amino acid dehydrogenase small subunit [Candidatus Terasakiella magnetica]
MRVLVLGAGVVGTTTAFYLKKAGHDVVVLDRQLEPAMETSYANGGQIAAAHADPWASPATPFKALKWLGKKEAPLLFHLFRFDPALWGWCLKFLTNCTAKKTDINTERTLRVALHSRQCLKELRKEIDLDYDHREEGIIHFYRDEKEFDLAVHAAETMKKYGLNRQVLSPDQCVETENALGHVKNRLVGGIYSKDDESGDAHRFTKAIAQKAVDDGVEFHFDHQIIELILKNNKAVGVKTDQGDFFADQVVVCLGSFSKHLLAKNGLNLPIYPAKGYSITLPLSHPEKAPQVSLTDDEFKLVFSRFGNRLRVAGTAELGGYSTAVNELRAQFILNKTMELFPGCANPDDVEFWAGLRPKTPDSVPLLGQTSIDSLYLNTGHGTLGWTMSCGCAQILSDIISQKSPKISLSGLGLQRF